MPSLKTTICLGVIFVIGLGFIFLFEAHTESTRERQRLARRVVRLSSDEVEMLRIRRDSWTSALIQRTGPGQFRVSEPVPRAVADEQVLELLSTVEFLDYQVVLAGEARQEDRLYQLALEPPRLEIDMAMSGEREVRLALGGAPPGGGGLYLLVRGGDDIYVVPQSLLQQAEKLLDVATGEPEPG